jgi:FkbM family methyltransferase
MIKKIKSIWALLLRKGFGYCWQAARNQTRQHVFIAWLSVIYRMKHQSRTTYSQYAEDLFIDRFFAFKPSGTYIDIGANHPTVFSNTKRFYDKGWRGVNIEPNPNNYRLFQTERPEDVNLNIGISRKKSKLPFYAFDEHTLSTFSADQSKLLVAEGYRLNKVQEVSLWTLADVFAHIKKNRVDFISIDTEGFEMEILQSNDWDKNRARLICIEGSTGKEYNLFFKKRGYKNIGSNGLNSFYCDVRSKE